ncbi:36688_t:CDS:1, partial [Gigaspora margarita]
TYDEKSQTADAEELPYLDKPLEVEENSDNKNIKESGPLYPIKPEMIFSN